MLKLASIRRSAARGAAALTFVGVLPAMALAQHGGHAAGNGAAATKDIVQTAVAAGSFSTLVAAVQAAGLVETLQSAGPFTVFAPSDAAFARLPQGTVEGLLADRARLTSLLTFHVVQGRVLAADIVRGNGASPRTVNGQALDVVVRDGAVYVNGARVVTADVQASNGVIHVIDTVLIPAPAPAGK